MYVVNPLFHQPTNGKRTSTLRYLGSQALLCGPVQQQLLNESACLGTELDTSADFPKQL